jgi:hypothetical protein
MSLKAKRRIEDVVNRIETALLKAEKKCWEDLDAPRRGPFSVLHIRLTIV